LGNASVVGATEQRHCSWGVGAFSSAIFISVNSEEEKRREEKRSLFSLSPHV